MAHILLPKTTYELTNHHDHTPSEQQELFAYLTRADPQGEADSLCCVTYGAQKPTDDGWSAPFVLPPTPPGLPFTPQTSRQPQTNASTAQMSWAFRLHVQEPPNEPVTLKPAIPEVIHPIQPGSTPQRPLLPRSDIEILTLFDDDISSIRDDHTLWVTADPTTVRARHMTDKGNAKPVFREARFRKCLSSPSEYKFDSSKPNRLFTQTRISISTWNPGPRRGTPGAFERHIARKWHVIASQEAIEYLQHETLANHYHISHFARCAVLFNKDTFYPDAWVSSVYIHDTKKWAAANC